MKCDILKRQDISHLLHVTPNNSNISYTLKKNGPRAFCYIKPLHFWERNVEEIKCERAREKSADKNEFFKPKTNKQKLKQNKDTKKTETPKRRQRT